MVYVLISVHLVLCFALTGLVLLQQGKGAEAGVALGGSNTLFGAGGATSFVTKLTTGIAIAFMVTSLLLVRSYGRMSVTVASPDALLEGTLFKEEPVKEEVAAEPNGSKDAGAAVSPEIPEGAKPEVQVPAAAVVPIPEADKKALGKDPEK